MQQLRQATACCCNISWAGAGFIFHDHFRIYRKLISFISIRIYLKFKMYFHTQIHQIALLILFSPPFLCSAQESKEHGWFSRLSIATYMPNECLFSVIMSLQPWRTVDFVLHAVPLSFMWSPVSENGPPAAWVFLGQHKAARSPLPSIIPATNNCTICSELLWMQAELLRITICSTVKWDALIFLHQLDKPNMPLPVLWPHYKSHDVILRSFATS